MASLLKATLQTLMPKLTPSDVVDTAADLTEIVENLAALCAEPLGAVSVIQRLLTLYSQDANCLASLFRDGVPTIPPDGLVGCFIAFLTPSSLSQAEKRAARRHQERILEKQATWPDLAAVQSEAQLLCFDGDPESGLPRQLYLNDGTPQLAGWSSFANLLEQLVALTSGGSLLQALPTMQSAITTVIYEVFKNTDDHAKHEVSGADVRTSLRGIYAQYHAAPSSPANKNLDAGIAHSPSFAFWASATGKRKSRSHPNFAPGLGANGILEISIFDSGPGMAARWCAHDVANETPKQQLASVLACFKKGQTSTSSPTRGFGLWKVLRSLEELNGFIGVRTNGIHAYRRFDTEIYRSTSNLKAHGARPVPLETLLDWRKGFAPEPSVYPNVRGTVITLLLPVIA